MQDLLSELSDDVPLLQRPLYKKVGLKRLVIITLILLSLMTLVTGILAYNILSEESAIYP